jgi:hypothetical protein
MVSLETLALANNPQDAGPSSPPKRHRKFTISYASAAKVGIIQNTENPSEPPPTQKQNNRPAAPSTATNKESDLLLTNSSTSKNIDAELLNKKNKCQKSFR